MKTNSRRKFLRNAGLGLSGLTIMPLVHGAKGSGIFNDDNFSLGDGTQAIEDDIDFSKFIDGKSSNLYFRNNGDNLSVGRRNQQFIEVFEEGSYLLQNDNIARAVDWKNGFVKTISIKTKISQLKRLSLLPWIKRRRSF